MSHYVARGQRWLEHDYGGIWGTWDSLPHANDKWLLWRLDFHVYRGRQRRDRLVKHKGRIIGVTDWPPRRGWRMVDVRCRRDS